MSNPKVDAYFARLSTWVEEMTHLRRIARSCPLVEELKWGEPCYTHEGKNVVLIHGFKDYCALLFMKGALLPDPAGVLVQQTENVQSGRQIRFTSARQITGMENVLSDYIHAAIEVEKAGLKVDFAKSRDLVYPEEFQARLNADPALQAAFEALTPGRRRAYNLFFSGAKQAATRAARVEKMIPQILAGKGIDDR